MFAGIKQFRRQLTKEEKLMMAGNNADLAAEEVLDDLTQNNEDVNKLKDDLGKTSKVLPL